MSYLCISLVIFFILIQLTLQSNGAIAFANREMNSKSEIKLNLNESGYYVYAQEEISCYKNCLNCNKVSLKCECEGATYGESCDSNYNVMQTNYKYSLFKPVSEWKSWGFYIEDKHQYEVEMKDFTLGSYVHYFFLGDHSIQYPNYSEGVFKTQGNSYKHLFTDDQIQTYIKRLKIKNTKQQPILIISLYSPPAITGQNQQQQQVHNQQQQQNAQQRRNRTGDVVNGRKMVCITQESIEKYMPPFKYQELIQNIPDMKEQKECIVCLQDFFDDELCRITICLHIFHKKCIDSWVKKNGNCPFCRHGLTKKVMEDKETLRTEYESNPYMQKIVENVQNQSIQINETQEDIDDFQEDTPQTNTIKPTGSPKNKIKTETSPTNLLRKIKGFQFLFSDSDNKKFNLDDNNLSSSQPIQHQNKYSIGNSSAFAILPQNPNVIASTNGSQDFMIQSTRYRADTSASSHRAFELSDYQSGVNLFGQNNRQNRIVNLLQQQNQTNQSPSQYSHQFSQSSAQQEPQNIQRPRNNSTQYNNNGSNLRIRTLRQSRFQLDRQSEQRGNQMGQQQNQQNNLQSQQLHNNMFNSQQFDTIQSQQLEENTNSIIENFPSNQITFSQYSQQNTDQIRQNNNSNNIQDEVLSPISYQHDQVIQVSNQEQNNSAYNNHNSQESQILDTVENIEDQQ